MGVFLEDGKYKTQSIVNFFKNYPMEDFEKSYIFDIQDQIGTKKRNYGIVALELKIIKQNINLLYELSLLTWSNKEQKYIFVDIKNLINENYNSKKSLPLTKAYWSKFIFALEKKLTCVKKIWQLKELIYHIENPTFIFHYKLLNLFTKPVLEEICKKYFVIHPVVNTALLTNKYTSIQSDLIYLFLPAYIQGFYVDDIEVSVDLNNDDIALIEDINQGKQLTKHEFLAKVMEN